MTHALRVLLVEDNATDARLARLLLESSSRRQYSVRLAPTLDDALSLIHDHSFDVALVDLYLPDCRGLESVRRLKDTQPDLPLVVLSSEKGDKLALEAIRSGAQEFLSKSHITGHELARVIEHSIARQDQLIQAQAQALVDPLTGIANRRAFDLELKKRLLGLRRHGSLCSVALLDLDHFKAVNDSLGHERGDRVLRKTASQLAASARESDLLARYGGEEFVLLLPGAALGEAHAILQRMRSELDAFDWSSIADDLRVTFSAGLAALWEDDNETTLLRRVDAALYAAKKAGRNCVCACETQSSPVAEKAPVSDMR